MVHDTLHVSVRGYIDTNDIEKQTKIVGWAFHEKHGARPMRLVYGDQIINAEQTVRVDIQQYYGRLDTQNSGWVFHNHTVFNKDVPMVVQMLVDDVWVKVFILRKASAVAPEQVSDPVPTSFTVEEVKNPSSTECNTKTVKSVPSFVVSDNFYEDPDSVRNFALSLDFKAHENYHKGKRTDACYRFPGLKERFEELIGSKITGWDKYGTNACFQYCIAGEQIVYHHDSQEYAGVLFLSPDAPPQTGTTFYRSRHTKTMKVSDADHGTVFQNGFLDPTAFDVVDVVGNVYNRVVLFDAKLIHAASCYFGTNLQNGRLFQLFFFDIEK